MGVAQPPRHRPGQPARTSATDSPIAIVTAFDFGAWRVDDGVRQRKCPSGMPMKATASAAATAVSSAVGSAMPMSSLAEMTSLLAMNRGSSPASTIRAR